MDISDTIFSEIDAVINFLELRVALVKQWASSLYSYFSFKVTAAWVNSVLVHIFPTAQVCYAHFTLNTISL